MKKIRTLTGALLLMGVSVCHADGFEYLVVEQASGATQQTALASFDQIRFTDHQMVILNGGTTMASYPLSSLRKMYFGAGATAISQVESERHNDQVEVYTLAGTLVHRGTSALSALPTGIYIVKDGNSVRKIAIR